MPDLLRRFVETPHASEFCIGSSRARLETNDPILAKAVQKALAACEVEPIGSDSNWKLIRDEQAPCGGLNVTVLSAGPIGTLLLGRGTVIAVDRERREILGFVAPDVSDKDFVTIVLPLVFKFL